MAQPRRTRTVIFRLTEAEYERLKAASSDAGARSLSGYTRSEVLSSTETDSHGMTVHERFHYIDKKLGDLQTSVGYVRDLLMKEVATRSAGAPPQPAHDE